MTHPYDYRVAEVVKVVDGDTIDLVVSVGFRWASTQRFRLLAVDTPELNSTDPAERERAQAAKAYVEEWLTVQAAAGFELRAATYKGDAFGRWVAEVYAVTDTGIDNLGHDLLEHGHAEPWPRRRTIRTLANAGDPGPQESTP